MKLEVSMGDITKIASAYLYNNIANIGHCEKALLPVTYRLVLGKEERR